MPEGLVCETVSLPAGDARGETDTELGGPIEAEGVESALAISGIGRMRGISAEAWVP